MRLFYADIFQQYQLSSARLPISQHDNDFKGFAKSFAEQMERGQFHGRTLLLVNRAGKTSWLAANFLWLCRSRAIARSIECT